MAASVGAGLTSVSSLLAQLPGVRAPAFPAILLLYCSLFGVSVQMDAGLRATRQAGDFEFGAITVCFEKVCPVIPPLIPRLSPPLLPALPSLLLVPLLLLVPFLLFSPPPSFPLPPSSFPGFFQYCVGAQAAAARVRSCFTHVSDSVVRECCESLCNALAGLEGTPVVLLPATAAAVLQVPSHYACQFLRFHTVVYWFCTRVCLQVAGVCRCMCMEICVCGCADTRMSPQSHKEQLRAKGQEACSVNMSEDEYTAAEARLEGLCRAILGRVTAEAKKYVKLPLPALPACVSLFLRLWCWEYDVMASCVLEEGWCNPGGLRAACVCVCVYALVSGLLVSVCV